MIFELSIKDFILIKDVVLKFDFKALTSCQVKLDEVSLWF